MKILKYYYCFISNIYLLESQEIDKSFLDSLPDDIRKDIQEINAKT